MAGPQVEVIGADRLASTLHAAASEIADMDHAAADSGRVLESQGSANAPKRTGRLARSVRADVYAPDVVVGSDLIYAPVIHNGWWAHHISPNPFLTRALDQKTNEVVDFYARDMNNAISGVKGA